MIPYRKPYLDSSVFIAFIKGETMKDGHDCKRVVSSIIEAASRGDFLIYTSALTLAEVFKKKEFLEDLTKRQNGSLMPYFREKYIRLVEVDRGVGERANELCCQHLRKGHSAPVLRPCDAIHLACAERAECDYLLAYDHHLVGQTHATIRIEWPTLFEKVTAQTGLFDVVPQQELLSEGK